MTVKNICFSILLFIFLPSIIFAQDLIYTQTCEIGVQKISQVFFEFKSEKIGTGTITIKKNDPSKNITRGHLFYNGKVISIQNFLVSDELIKQLEVQIASENKFLLFISGDKGASLTLTWTHGAPVKLTTQEQPTLDLAQQGAELKKSLFNFAYYYFPEFNVKNSNGGAISTHQFKTSLTYSYFSAGYDLRNDIWKDIKKLDLGNKKDDPWGMLHSFYLSAQDFGTGSKEGDWSYTVKGLISSSFEKDPSSSFAAKFNGSINYFVLPNGQIKLGGIFYHNNVKTDIRPSLSAEWNTNQTIKKGFILSVGYPDSSISYRFESNVAARLYASFDSFTIYKLGDDNPILSSGYLEHSSNVVGFNMDYKTDENIILNIGLLYQYATKFGLYNKENHAYPDGSIEMDNSIGLTFQFTTIF